jgi:hypothetical protein
MCRSPSSRRRWKLLLKQAIFLLPFLAPILLHAQTISGTVQDPSGAVIAGARIEISGSNLPQPLVLSSDGQGKFFSPQLKPGTYILRVLREGFEPLVKTIDLQAAAQLELTLTIAQLQVNVNVAASGLANRDPIYRQLREIGLGQTFRFDNYTLTWDVATFHFQQGTLTFLAPVKGVVTGAIFIGEGHFNLKPVTALDTRELSRRISASEVDEDFTEIVFRFTGDARLNLLPGIGASVEPPSEAADALRNWKDHMRRRQEITSFTQSLLYGETMDNVDADELAALYNPGYPPFFNAYLRGKKHKDLRFYLRHRLGALPAIDSPEEVACINVAPDSLEDGVWYLQHLKSELAAHIASSSEDRRLFATHRYKIETVIAKNGHLFSTASISFASLLPGERVLKFGLLPNLRVSRVTDDHGQDLYFIQESRKQDGSFYAILPQAPAVGAEQSINVEYAGDNVLQVAGEGSYYVGARTSWYPNLNGFGEHSLYDLTFKVPRKYTVISVGELQKESAEGDLAVTHWVTPTPVAVAGFNYGAYEKLEEPDDITHYKIYGYYLTELPDNLRNRRALQSMAPKAMTKYALEQTRAQMQLCTFYFGKIPYQAISVTEQPNFNFGQSWPDLVYLPISAYTDSTERWMLFGQINNKFTGFVQEVTPHEVAHQWWGHAVGWASYHDQWLSEGFAEFSAGLFLEQAVGEKWQKDYIEFWERLRQRILEKNNFGIAPNDAGPLWMGTRLMAPRTMSAYQNVTYPKGAYVLSMLRSMMHDNTGHENKEENFIAMMHDFVQAHADRAATTESFKAIAEKHMTKQMDIAGNHRLDWFFDQWVYGTQVPKYHFDYQVTPAEAGKFKLHMTLTQSEVDDHFAMLVPIYVDFGKGMARLGQATITGNTTRTIDVTLPAQPKKVALNAYKEILER